MASPVRTASKQAEQSLGARFDPRWNSLNALRLILASLVVVSHAWPLTGAGDDPEWGGQTLGTWSVVGFFIISGFLISRSRDRRGAKRYVWDRFLRIYPAFLVAMLVTAFAFAPVSTLITGAEYHASDGVTYVIRNSPLYPPWLNQHDIGTTLASAPRQEWNGPVWTLFWEAFCYAAVGVGYALVPRRQLPWIALGCLPILTAATFAATDGAPMPWQVQMAVPLLLAFNAGVVAYFWRDTFPASGRAAAVASVVLVATCLLGEVSTLGALPYAVVLFWLATRLPLQRLGREFDLSYGIYIYGWPVQQLVVLLAVANDVDIPIALDIAVVLAVAAGLALLSVVLVEHPSHRLRRLVT